MFHSVPNDLLSVSSLPVTICPCQSFQERTRRCEHVYRHAYPLQYPGQVFQLSVLAVDAIGRPAYANAFIQVLEHKQTNMKLMGHIKEIYPLYRNICNKLNFTLAITKLHSPSLGGTLQISTDYEAYLNVHIGMLPCPIGFTITDTGVCDCSTLLTSLHDNSIRCDINTSTITLPAFSWFGQFLEEGVEGFSPVCRQLLLCTLYIQCHTT